MNKRTLGPDGPEVSAIGLGCMGMSAFYGSTDEGESLRTIQRALDLGCNFLDTSDMYGPAHQRAARRRARSPAGATRCSWRRSSGSSSSRASRPRLRIARSTAARPTCAACEGSLERLGKSSTSTCTTSTASTRTRRSRRRSARWRSWWPRARSVTSACPRRAPQTIRRAHAVHPITAVQTEYSLWTRDVEEEILPTLERAGDRAGRVLAARARLPVGALQLAGGARRGRLPPLRAALHGREPGENLKLAERVKELAEEKGITPGQLALAWVLHRGEHIVPIPGTKRRSPTWKRTSPPRTFG
jgi:aryl-alcohol dehydrogenase-like predicted oxidoreductase